MKLNNLMFGMIALCVISVQQGLSPFTGIGIALFVFAAWIAWDFCWRVGVAVIQVIKDITKRYENLKLPANKVTIRESLKRLEETEYKGQPAAHILNSRSEEFKGLLSGVAAQLEPKDKKHFQVLSTFDLANSRKIIHTIEAYTPEAVSALTELKNRLLLSGKSDVSFS